MEEPLYLSALFMLHFVKGKMNPLTGRNVKLNRLHKLFAKLKEGVPALVKPFLGNSMDDWCNSQFVLSLLILWSHLGLQSTVKPPTCPLVDRLTELPWPSVFTLTLHEGCIHKQHLCVCFIDKHQPPPWYAILDLLGLLGIIVVVPPPLPIPARVHSKVECQQLVLWVSQRDNSWKRWDYQKVSLV